MQLWWRCDLLVRQNRKVLRDGVTEDRTEDADVKAASIARANDGLVSKLIGQSDARSEHLLFLIVPAHVSRDSADACHVQVAVIQIQERPFPSALTDSGK